MKEEGDVKGAIDTGARGKGDVPGRKTIWDISMVELDIERYDELLNAKTKEGSASAISLLPECSGSYTQLPLSSSI
jgi:hypothetical protein